MELPNCQCLERKLHILAQFVVSPREKSAFAARFQGWVSFHFHYDRTRTVSFKRVLVRRSKRFSKVIALGGANETEYLSTVGRRSV